MSRRHASVLAALLASCTAAPDLADYDRTCEMDEDCVLVPIGDPCQVCPDQEGVRSDEAAAYREAWSKVQATCGPLPAIACVPDPVEPRCLGGTCRAAPVSSDTDA